MQGQVGKPTLERLALGEISSRRQGQALALVVYTAYPNLDREHRAILAPELPHGHTLDGLHRVPIPEHDPPERIVSLGPPSPVEGSVNDDILNRESEKLFPGVAQATPGFGVTVDNPPVAVVQKQGVDRPLEELAEELLALSEGLFRLPSLVDVARQGEQEWVFAALEQAHPDVDGEGGPVLAPVDPVAHEGHTGRHLPPRLYERAARPIDLHIRHIHAQELLARVSQTLARPTVRVDNLTL